MIRALAIAEVNLRRLVRDRANVFFVVLFPLLLIVVLGLSYGGGFEPRIAVFAGSDGDTFAEQLIADLEATVGVRVERVDDEHALVDAVERGRAQAGLAIPAGYEQAVRSGETIALRYYARAGELGLELQPITQAALASQGARVIAARVLVGEGLASFDDGLELAGRLASVVPAPAVAVERVGTAVFPESLDMFDLSASQQLLLFVFLTSLTSAVALIETRQLGISRRVLATPTAPGVLIAGEALGRLAIAMTQGLVIMLGSLVLFGVNWGDPLGAAAILVAFSLVGSGAGMLLGSTLGNTQQAGALALLVGLGFGALGGSMVPLEVFPDTMRRVAHLTPHAWGIEAFATLVRRDGSLADILGELAVLLAIAVVLYGLAAWRLRHAITA